MTDMRKIMVILIIVFGLLVYVSLTYVFPRDETSYNNISNNMSDNISNNMSNNIYLGNDSRSRFIHPNMYLNSGEIEDIKKRIDRQPWKGAYEDLISEANEALGVSIQSVTFGGKTPPGGDQHDYYSDGPYITGKDGVYNPDADRSDYNAAINIGKYVRALGLAYAITGDSRYADKAIQFINGWTVDPKTRMNPKLTNSQSFIEIRITMPGMFYGADLIWNYPGWKFSDKGAFKSWTREMIKPYRKPSSKFEPTEHWRLLFITTAAVVTEDMDIIQYSTNRWKEIIPIVMTTEGEMTYELKRTRSLFYSLYAVNAMVQTAEIARHYDIDLYSYKTSDGKGLERALDFYAPYATGKKEWPHQEIRPDLVEYNLYELAYSWKDKDSYKDVIVEQGRPVYDRRTMGPVTLTHAR